MRHNDYIVIGTCHTCGKHVFKPRVWSVHLRKINGIMVHQNAPSYRTCLCPGKKEE